MRGTEYYRNYYKPCSSPLLSSQSWLEFTLETLTLSLLGVGVSSICLKVGGFLFSRGGVSPLKLLLSSQLCLK